MTKGNIAIYSKISTEVYIPIYCFCPVYRLHLDVYSLDVYSRDVYM